MCPKSLKDDSLILFNYLWYFKKTPIVEGALIRASSLEIGGSNLSSLNTLVVFIEYAIGLISLVFNSLSFSI